MNLGQKELRHKQMKISQLCKESGFKRSTIHYYLNLGLLSPPRRVGLNLFIYDETHLSQLRQIRHLREQEKLPLTIIKEILSKRQAPLETLPAEIRESQQADQKREQILKAATELFSQKGYDKTTITDIVEALNMGRGTFYLYFKDKRELFIECIEHLTLIIVPQEFWEDIRKERDIIRRQRVRGLAFQKAFPGFRGILNLLRQAMAGDDPLLAQKARDTFKALIQPLAKEHRRAINKGIFRETDEELVGYFALALSEMLGFRLMMDDRYTLEEGLNLFQDFMYNGILAHEAGGSEKNKTGVISGEVTDQKGVTTRLLGIRFDEKSDLIGRLGQAEVYLDLDKIDSFKIRNSNVKCLVEITLKDGQSVTLEMSGDILLSGQAPFGKYTIPLKGVGTITFIEDK
ncbi:MAG: TetR family transcriptional regulator [Pseudomonadota bacterium]